MKEDKHLALREFQENLNSMRTTTGEGLLKKRVIFVKRRGGKKTWGENYLWAREDPAQELPRWRNQVSRKGPFSFTKKKKTNTPNGGGKIEYRIDRAKRRSRRQNSIIGVGTSI